MGMLDNKVAVVTGAGQGIGRGHALELARHGAKVIVNDLGSSVHGEGTGKAADDTVALIVERGGQAASNFANVADYAAAGEMVAQAIDTYGQLDILVNNAGIVRDSAIWNMDEADFDSVIAVHLKGAWAPSKHARLALLRSRQCTAACLAGAQAPLRCTAITEAKSAPTRVQIPEPRTMPALLTRMPSHRWVSPACATIPPAAA